MSGHSTNVDSVDKKGYFWSIGALAGGMSVGLTALCCITPLALGAFGLGLASLGAKLEPYRPYLTTATFLFLGFGFFQAYRPQRLECEDGKVCATPKGRRSLRIALWIIAVLALILSALPYAASYYTYLTL